MTTHDLTKELSALVTSLRSLSYDASAEVAKTLQLEQRRHGMEKRANKYCPPLLTLAAISAAVGGATRKPVRTVQLRQDVFDRRYKKLASQFATKLVADVRAAASRPFAPAGTAYSVRYSGMPGIKSVHDVLPKYDRTAINADAYAWSLAAHYAVMMLVDAYGSEAIRRFTYDAAPGNDAAGYDRRDGIRQKIEEARDAWQEKNTFVLCESDRDGQVVRINGVDPRPFVMLLSAAGAGDPLGILNTAPVPVIL